MLNLDIMKKYGIGLVITGGLIGVGIILSFYGNYVIFEDLAKTSGVVNMENDLALEVNLDNTKSKTGVFAVQIMDFKDQSILVSIVDPYDITIETKTINEESSEGNFEINNSGIYKLVIENKGNDVTVFGVIGPEPDESKKLVAFTSLYILVIGLIGMAIVAILIARNRKRRSS